MYRKFAVLFSLIVCMTEIFGQFDLIRAVFEAEDRNVTRVRTVAELEARKGENVALDFIGLVQQYKGYTAEEYDVQTDDGYILKLHRITGSPRSPAAPGKPVVYIQHGLFASTDFHVILGPQQALAFLLADEGYDVWNGNVRGNSYSKSHVKLSSLSNNHEFWNFSIDELGSIDVPKFIDTVLEKTKLKKLTYIGYSMGTTASYKLLSEKPEYNSKMNLVISLAPVAFFTEPYGDLVKLLRDLGPAIDEFAEQNKIYELFPQAKLLQVLGEGVCGSTLGKAFCGDLFSLLTNPKNLNTSTLANMLAYVPAGSSLNTVNEFYQMLTTGEVRKYDFGESTNLEKYGSATPPQYDFTKITAPFAIYYADADAFVSIKDAEKLKNTLKNVVVFQQTPSGYNHLDYFLSTDVRDVFYKQILEAIKKYE